MGMDSEDKRGWREVIRMVDEGEGLGDCVSIECVCKGKPLESCQGKRMM